MSYKYNIEEKKASVMFRKPNQRADAKRERKERVT